MTLYLAPNIPRQEEVLNVRKRRHNLKNVAGRPDFLDSKWILLKLRRERLRARLAYIRQQSLLAEVELRLAETDIKYELIRRRQFVARSRAIRKIMKLPFDVTNKKVAATGRNHKTTVSKSTQVDEQFIQNPDKDNDIMERRRLHKKKLEGKIENNLLIKDSRIGAGETPCDSARAAVDSEQTENSIPSKKRKTDKESHCADKREIAKSDSREKQRVKRDGKTKASKDKSQKKRENNKNDTSNNMQGSSNDKRKDTESENNEENAKQRHDAKSKNVKKPITTTNPTSKKINSNNTDRAQASTESSSEETPLIIEETDNSKASEENNAKNMNGATVNEAVQPSNDSDIVSSSSDLDLLETAAAGNSIPDFTVVWETSDSNLVHTIQKMCETPKKDLLDDDYFEDLGNVKRERSNSISSVETLLL